MKMFTKILTKIVMKKLSKSYTKKFMRQEVGCSCLLFKFGFMTIFVRIFVPGRQNPVGPLCAVLVASCKEALQCNGK